MSAVAQAVTSPSNAAYDDAVKLVERWAQTGGASDEEKLQFLAETTAGRKNTSGLLNLTIDMTKDQLEDLACHALDACNTCGDILEMLNMFAKGYGIDEDSSPTIFQFIWQWEAYTTDWKNDLALSKSFAYQSAKEYTSYASILEQVDSITTKEEMQNMADYLKEFAQRNPADVPVDFKDKFLDLERNLVDFQQQFDDVVNNLPSVVGQGSSYVALNNAKSETKALQAQVDRLNHQITDATTALAVPPWWGLLSIPFPSHLQALVAMRNEKQKELRPKLDVAKTSMNYEDPVQALMDIRDRLDTLAPDFYLLDTFADIWNDFHNEALDFATKFEKVENPSSLPSLYKARIKAALDATDPLVDGLNAYAEAIYY